MDIRYSANQKDFKRYTTEETRNEFLIENLYVANEVVAVYSHVDRMVTLGACRLRRLFPSIRELTSGRISGQAISWREGKSAFFNIGGAGKITADGEVFDMNYKDCLYITKGTKEVLFSSNDAANPAKFYMVSAPAHKACETTFIPIEKGAKKPLGAMETSNKRVINQFYPSGCS